MGLNKKGNTSDKDKLIQRIKLVDTAILNMRLSQMKDEKIIDSISKLKVTIEDFFSIVKIKK